MSETQKLPTTSRSPQIIVKPDEKHARGIDFRAAYAVLVKAYVRNYVARASSVKRPKAKGGYKP